MILLPFEEALKSYGTFLKNRRVKEGTFLYVPPNTHSSLELEGAAQVSVGKNGSLTLVHSGVVDLALEAGANVKLVSRTNLQVYATLKRDAQLEVFYVGGQLSAEVKLLEENGYFSLKSLSMLTGKETADVSCLVDHAAPHCTSRQHVKMLLDGESRSHFDGKIFVRQAAQKTEAYQLNNNLLLSETAVATAKPNLEIFADDVKASHGATFAQLNDEELFYFQSRGVPLDEAKKILREAFCREILDLFRN